MQRNEVSSLQAGLELESASEERSSFGSEQEPRPTQETLADFLGMRGNEVVPHFLPQRFLAYAAPPRFASESPRDEIWHLGTADFHLLFPFYCPLIARYPDIPVFS